jgi:putative restriction endonuclease
MQSCVVVGAIYVYIESEAASLLLRRPLGEWSKVSKPQIGSATAIAAIERERRSNLRRQLRATGPGPYAPSQLRELGIYGGAAGIWVDRQNTAVTPEASHGVTVSILHTGQHYPDDLSESGLIYHYPKTNRPPRRDQNEVDATKVAKQLLLPIFVVLPHTHNQALRDVKLGWVDDWDDKAQEFLIIFSETPVASGELPNQGSTFLLQDEQTRGKRGTTLTRPNQQRFRFQVLKAYGPKCAVCSVTRVDLLVAAHICPKSARGSDDWRNGLVLCGTHHAAFDLGLFGFEPERLTIILRDGCDAAGLGITTQRFSGSSTRPHPDAIRYHGAFWNLIHG